MKHIGIIGTGVVGKTLVEGFKKHGYTVSIGTRNASKFDELKSSVSEGINVNSFNEVAATADIIVLAVKGTAAVEAIQLAGISNLAGKTIIDATNPIAELPPVDGVLQYFTAPNESLMEQLQALAPEANFVKCFSCVGAYNMVNPEFEGGKPTMFIAGNNSESKTFVSEVLTTFGWESLDMGTATAARAIEPLAMLWCIPGFLHNQWAHAFKLLTK